MLGLKHTVFAMALLSCTSIFADDPVQNFDTRAQTILTKHLDQYKDQEYFSGAALSVYIPDEKIKNFYAGFTSHDKTSRPISKRTLFQIGSITKSFTAATLLALEKEKKLTLSDTLKDWLPEYNLWPAITITQLLNMTNGLPNYSDTPSWNTAEAKNPMSQWTKQELIQFVYPSTFAPPLRTGYFYSNTGYVLADLIAEKAAKSTFESVLLNRTINKAKLQNTFYPIPAMDSFVQARLANGYNYNQYDNPLLVGKDLHTNNLSWAGAAGGIVSNSEDITKWVKAIFIDDDILDKAQKEKLTRLISVDTGEPLSKTTEDDPRGFGLGVIQAYDEHLGRYWFYEGKTLGFRALYFYSPCNNVIISTIFNSATFTENDHASDLIKNIYKLILQENPKLRC